MQQLLITIEMVNEEIALVLNALKSVITFRIMQKLGQYVMSIIIKIVNMVLLIKSFYLKICIADKASLASITNPNEQGKKILET